MRDTYFINWGNGEQWQVSRHGFEWFAKMDSMLSNLWNSVMASSREGARYWADKEFGR